MCFSRLIRLFVVLFLLSAAPVSAALSVPSSLNTTTSTTGGTSLQIGADITTTTGALLIVVAGVGTTTGAFTFSAPTDTLGTLTFTKWEDASGPNQPTGEWWRVAIWTAPIASGTTGRVTIVTSVSCSRWAIAVSQVTGQDTSTPVTTNHSQVAASTSATPSITLSAPASTSLVFGALGSRGDTDGISPGCSGACTELNDIVSGGPAESRLETEYDLASAGTTVDWSGASTSNNNGVAIEIAEASAGGGPTNHNLTLTGAGPTGQ